MGRDAVTRRVLRWEVPVDGEWHVLDVLGDLVHVACRKSGVVEFWADGDDEFTTPMRRTFRVFGTGHHVAPTIGAHHRGTATDGLDVYHLFELG
jgi:hypothetical protein